MKNKPFNCVEMMHQGAEKVYQEVKGMTMEQELAYWKQQTDTLRQLKREAEEKLRKAL